MPALREAEPVPRIHVSRLSVLLLALVLPGPVAWAQEAGKPADEYAAMLGYLAETRLDDRAFVGARGAVAVNMAAGDLNLQANLRSFAVGERAIAMTDARQQQVDERYDVPHSASARIAGRAFNGASGLVSINQASGSGNAELNSVAVVLAAQGVREATDEQLSSAVSASAGGQGALDPGVAKTGTRNVAVEATALRGFEGLLQLNQVAGSGNATGNHFGLSVPPTP